MAFSHTTFASAKTQLAELLGDASKTFWTDAELSLYIKESLQTWGALSLYWRDRELLSGSPGTSIYDLTSLPTLAPSILDQDLLLSIQYHLIEPPSANNWLGTEMFTLSEIQSALQRRMNQFLLETGLLQTYSTVLCPTPGNGRIPLPDTVQHVSRVAWQPAGGSLSPLYQGDELQFNSFRHNWSYSGGNPQAFSIVSEPNLTIQLAPIPLVPASLGLTSINSGTNLNLSSGVILRVPNDLAWILKWGALAELLSSGGISKDNPRATYCEKRWTDGLEVAKLYPSILNAQIGGVPIPLSSMKDLDTMATTWQNSSGSPTTVGLGCYNIVGLYPVPSAAVQLELDVVRPAILPTTDADCLQIGRDYLSIILNYAQHLAAFKQGGPEFEITQSGLQDLMDAAQRYNARLKSSALFWPQMMEQAQKDQRHLNA